MNYYYAPKASIKLRTSHGSIDLVPSYLCLAKKSPFTSVVGLHIFCSAEQRSHAVVLQLRAKVTGIDISEINIHPRREILKTLCLEMKMKFLIRAGTLSIFLLSKDLVT